MIKLKKLFVELADDFSKKERGGKREWPYYKRWRVWCNGVCLGDILKFKDLKTNKVHYTINVFKADIGDIYHYHAMPDGKRVFMKDWKDPRTNTGFTTLKQAYSKFKEQFIANINHYIEP